MFSLSLLSSLLLIFTQGTRVTSVSICSPKCPSALPPPLSLALILFITKVSSLKSSLQRPPRFKSLSSSHHDHCLSHTMQHKPTFIYSLSNSSSWSASSMRIGISLIYSSSQGRGQCLTQIKGSKKMPFLASAHQMPIRSPLREFILESTSWSLENAQCSQE